MKRKVCMDTYRVIQCSASGVGVAVHRTPVDRTTAISSSTTCCILVVTAGITSWCTDCTR